MKVIDLPKTPNGRMEPLMLRAEEVAALLRIGRSTVFELMAAGELPVVRIGRSTRIPRAALEKWIADRTEGGPTSLAS